MNTEKLNYLIGYLAENNKSAKISSLLISNHTSIPSKDFIINEINKIHLLKLNVTILAISKLTDEELSMVNNNSVAFL